MYGMLCAMLATGIWLLIATLWELPVSTTHSIVGAVIGMSMVAAGPDSVVWYKHNDSGFPIDGVAGIIISWVISPILAGNLAACLFLFVRHAVLRRKNSYNLSLYMFPLFTFLTVFIVVWFVLKKAGANFGTKDIGAGEASWISAVCATGCSLLAAWPGIPFMRARSTKAYEKSQEVKDVVTKMESGESDDAAAGAVEGEEDGGSSSSQKPNNTPAMLVSMRKSKVWAGLTKGISDDVHECVLTDEKIASIHAHAEVFDSKTEYSFNFLQVFSACVNSLAHGSNDVANSIGPLAAIYTIWNTSAVPDDDTIVPKWILAIGGVGMVLGLATLGYKIMRSLGVKMCKLTPSRGFSVELSAATIVIIGSYLGLPLSTTHCMVGSVSAIGMLEGAKGFNGMLLLKFFAGWVATLIVAGLTSAAFTAQGIYAPNLTMSERYEPYGTADMAPASAPAANTAAP